MTISLESTSSNPMAFSVLNLRPELTHNLHSLNYHNMTPIQAQSLPLILNKTDVIAQAQTGSGKTIAFGLGILNQLNLDATHTQALILCPTRELAEQVSQVLRQLARLIPNIKISNISGGTPIKAQFDSLRHAPNIIIGTPGRIQKHLDKKTIDLTNIKTLVLDEADRMLDMGFFDSIQHVLSYCSPNRHTLLFSATFTPSIKKIAQQFMQKPQEIIIEQSINPMDIQQHFFEVSHHSEKYAVLKKILMAYQPTSTIIFCNTKEKTQEVTTQLLKDGFSACVLNGDLEQADRDKAIIQFGNHSRCILVATDVAARGLDIEKLPAVINFDLAFEPEVHIHRIGRTGRAGSTGLAFSITTPKDAERLCLIEDIIQAPLTWKNSDELTNINIENTKKHLPKMSTLRLMAGKKEKLRPGDILGALIKDAGLTSDLIGKIDILPAHTYIAIERNHARTAYNHFQNGKIKGKKIGVQFLS